MLLVARGSGGRVVRRIDSVWPWRRCVCLVRRVACLLPLLLLHLHHDVIITTRGRLPAFAITTYSLQRWNPKPALS